MNESGVASQQAVPQAPHSESLLLTAGRFLRARLSWWWWWRCDADWRDFDRGNRNEQREGRCLIDSKSDGLLFADGAAVVKYRPI